MTNTLTEQELHEAKRKCVSEDLSTWPLDRLHGELYRLHALVPRLIAECERLRAIWSGANEARLLAERDALRAENEKLRGAVLRPFDTSEVIAALHEGHVERKVAEHDNAWTSLVRQRDEARAECEKLKAFGLCGANAAGVICGCSQRFVSRDEIYRCVDCGVEFHKHCAREHFAKSGNNFLSAKEEAQLEAKELRLDVRDLRAECERMRAVAMRIADATKHCRMCRECGDGPRCSECDVAAACAEIEASEAKETR